MSETERIAQQLEVTWKGDAWHGPGLSELTDGLTAKQAATHHVSEAHSIWELVRHLTGWLGEVGRRLDGSAPTEPAGGDWPDTGEVVEERWVSVRAALGVAVADLAARIRGFDENRLDQAVGPQRDRALGTGTTYYVMLHGAVQHNLYHAGQIALLRKLA
jgi:hypothetical protein